MAHDPILEQRLADALAALGARAEPKKMFGGVAFMVNGNMCVGITNKSDLMVRFASERHDEIAKWPGAKPMTHGKGDMKGFLFVDPRSVADTRSLERWVKLALDHVKTLPKKTAKKPETATPKRKNITPPAKRSAAQR